MVGATALRLQDRASPGRRSVARIHHCPSGQEIPMNNREVVILSGVRTAIGDYGGSLKDIPPDDLAARVVKEAVSRAKIDPSEGGQCVFGHVIHTEPRDMYLSRLACVNGGLPHDTGALTLNRLCGSGFQA